MVIINVKKNNTYKTNHVFQWDSNRRLDIFGLNLSSLPEIHFANSRMPLAIVKQSAWNENGGITTEIPNELLETTAPITVYVCGYEGEEFITYYALVLNVKARTKPADYIAEDDEKIYSYNALENLVNNALVKLREENATFHDEMIDEVNARCDRAVSEMRDIIENTAIADADTLDGYNAEDFVFASKPGTTIFNADGSITTSYNDGSSETVVFNSDGSITTTRNTLEMGVKTETVIFNADGSITVTAV